MSQSQRLAATVAAANAAASAARAAPSLGMGSIVGGATGVNGGMYDPKRKLLEHKKKLLWGNKKKEVEAIKARGGDTAHVGTAVWRQAQLGSGGDKAKFLKMMGDKQGAAAAQSTDGVSGKPQIAADVGEDGATRVLAFSHGYDRSTLLDKDEVPQIKEDIQTEAERVGGAVLALELPTPQSNANALPGIGYVFIAFGTLEGARKAHFAMNGRFFNGHTVDCQYYDEMEFAKGNLADPTTLKMVDSGSQQRVWHQLEKQYDMGLVSSQSRSGLGSWQYRAPGR